MWVFSDAQISSDSAHLALFPQHSKIGIINLLLKQLGFCPLASSNCTQAAAAPAGLLIIFRVTSIWVSESGTTCSLCCSSFNPDRLNCVCPTRSHDFGKITPGAANWTLTLTQNHQICTFLYKEINPTQTNWVVIIIKIYCVLQEIIFTFVMFVFFLIAQHQHFLLWHPECMVCLHCILPLSHNMEWGRLHMKS